MRDCTTQALLSLDRVLLLELDHRTNNELASAICVLSLAAARSKSEDIKTALTATAELLHSYARVHRALQMPVHNIFVDVAAYVCELCLAISHSRLASREIRLVLVTEPLSLEADRCWRLGMMVYELITNAARHAFHRGTGEIRVELLNAGASVKCSVVDNGSADASVVPGRGLKIIGELIKSLGGHVEQKFGPEGSNSILVFPCVEATEHQEIGRKIEKSRLQAAVVAAKRKKDVDRCEDACRTQAFEIS